MNDGRLVNIQENTLVDPGRGRVIASTERTTTGVVYRVLVEGKVVNEETVLFGQDRRFRAGGLAFIEAAARQLQIAQEHARS